MIFKGKKSKESGTVQSGPAFTGSNYDQNLETLEVHEMGASTSPHNQEPRAPDFRSIPFSRRKAIVVSSVLTGVVLLFTGVSSVFFTRTDKNRGENPVELTSDLTLRSDEKFGLPAELQGSEESLVIKGDIITQGVIKISNGGNVMVVQATNLTANRTFSLPDVSGTFCTDANNCNYAGLDQLGQLNTQVAQLGQQLSNFELIADSGVTSVNNQTGTIAIQGSTNRILVNTAGGVITLSTPQELDANANVQFGSLTVSAAGVIRANNFTQTGAGNDVSISAGSDAIMFTAGGRTFQLPVSGPGTQTICTDGALCATGAGEAVLLSDGAAQTDTDADASIFINDTGGGHLIRLQSMGVDRLAVDNNGNTTVGGSLTVSALGNGFVRSTAGALSVVNAIDLASSDVTNTLPVNRGGTGAASLTANGVLVGNGTSPVSSVAAGGSGLCLVSTAGAPTFTTCPGVSSLNGQSGSLTLQGTANQVSVSTAAGVITLSTPQDINTSSSPTFAALTLSGLSNGVVRASAGTLTTGLVSLTAEVSGTLPVGNGGTGTATTPSNGQLLIGNGTNYTLATLTQGAGMVITNGAGSITIASAFGNSIDLGSETTGDFVASVSGSGGVNVTGGTGAGSTPSLSLVLQANKGLEVDGNGLSLIDCGLNQILKYNGSNQWACAADETGSFTIAGDSGTAQNVANGDTVTIQGGTNISTSAGATDTITINTVNNPTFTASVTTPLLQSSGALTITPNGALTVGATGQTALLQGSTTTITSNGLGNDIVLSSADQIRFSGFDCTAFANGGTLTTDVSGNISCADDNGAAANTITGTGTANRIALYTGSQTIADSWLLQNGSTLELDNTRNLSLSGGNFSVTGTGLFTGLVTANGGLTIETGDTFTFNGEAFTDLTGTGLEFSSGSLQTTLGTSIDLTTEVTGVLPVVNGGTGVNGSTAANGTLLIGNGTGFTLATLTAGAGITVNNSAGGIEVVNVFGTSIESGEITDLTITNADIANSTIDISTKTTGNFVATVSGSSQVSVSGSGSNNAAVTLGIIADSIGDTQLAFDTGQNLTATSSPSFNGLTLSGNLTVQGGNASVGTATQAGSLTLSDGSSNTGALQTAGLGQNTAFTLPDPGAATATICLDTGNCAGAGGGVTTAGGTANRIAIFNGAQTIADSWLLQSGSTLQLDNTRNLELIGGNLALTSGNLSITGNQTTSGTVTFSGLANGFLEVNGTGVVNVGTIDLGADTAGNYVATITAGNGISGASNTEGGTPTIALSNLTADWIQSGAFDIVLGNAGSEIRILESVGGTFYGTFDVGDLSADQTYTFLQGGNVVTSGNVSSYATTGVTAGNGLTGGGTTGLLTVNIGAGNGIQVNADDIAVVYGSTASTAVEGDTQITVTAGTNLTGGGTITLGAGGTLTVNVADSPTFAGSVAVQGGSVTVGTATQAGAVSLHDGSSNTATLQTNPLAQNTAFNLIDPGQASVDICLSTGNCAGAGGGVTTAGGTANRIAMFNGGQTIADSWLLQNGSTLQLDNTRSLELIGGNLTLASGNLSVTGNQTTSGTVTFSALANGFLEVNGTGVVAVGTIDLGTDTSGNYVATITAGNGISGTATGEGSTPTIALGNLTADWVQSGAFDIVLDNSGAEVRIRESNGAFYGLFDVGDLTADQTYTFLQGGTVVTSGNVSTYATTGVTAGSGLTGGGTTGLLTVNIGAGNGIQVNADDIAVIYGSTANTAVQGNTQLTVTAGTNLTGGGTITLGAGGSLTVNVADSPTFAGTVNVQGATLTIGTGTQQGSLVLNDGSTNTGTLQTAALGQNTAFTLPDPGQATADICLSTGNCAGAGNGITGSGTQNSVAKFGAGGDNITDSTLTDDGTNVTTSVDLIVQGGSATIGTALQNGALTLYGNGFTGQISGTFTANRAFTLPDGAGEFCIKELGNCSGSGGGNAPENAQYLVLALDAGLSAERTLSFSSTNFTVADNGANNSYTVNTAQNIATTSAPSFAGLTLTGNLNLNANTIQGTTAVIDFNNFDVASTGAVTAGTYNGQTISSSASFTGTLTVAGLTTLNGGLNIEAGDTLTFNGDAFTDLTGNGLQVTTGALTIAVQANKGLEVDASGLSLVDCANGEILKYNTTGGTWGCASDAGAGGTGDDVLVNGSNADGANFVNTTATAAIAGVSISLNTASTPDEVAITLSDASATLAGIVTANAQTFGGAKTFNGQIVAGAGINLGAQTLSGTTAVIDFNNFDVSAAGAVTAVGVNAGSGLIQGTGGVTVGGTVTFSSLTSGFLEVNGSGVVSVGTIDLGTDTDGNYVATITAGNGISGSSNTEGGTPTIALSNLTADWIQSGAFDIALANAGSELKIMESVGNTFYAIFDAADLSADQTFLLNEGGTVITSGNVASYATTAVTAGSGLTGGGTVGALTLNIASANGGIVVNANDIALTLQANKGLEVDANGLSLIDCANGEVLKYETTGNTWACASDAGASGTGDDVLVNGSNADGANFVNTTASASVAGVTISLNTATTPDEISMAIGEASGTLAGIVTANAQTFGGAKTFNGQIIAGAGINLGAQTFSGTTAVIDFNNFDVSSTGAVTAVGVNAGSGLIQGTGGITIAGTTTLSSLTNGFLEVNGTGVVSVGTIDLGTDTAGNYVATITAGNGISGSATGEGSTPTIALSNLTADWIQSGAFDIALANASSELKIMESVGGTFYAILDTADLAADQTFTLNQGGTVVTSGNVGLYATTGVTAGSGLTGGGTVGALTLNIGAGNGVSVAADSITLSLQANKGLEVDANGLSLIDCATDGYVLKYSTGTSQWACAADSDTDTTLTEAQVEGYIFDTDNVAGATSIAANANGINMLTLRRNTDTSPTGNFLSLQNAAAANLFNIDINGTVTAGTWQGSEIADAYISNSLTIASTGSVDWAALTNYPTGCAAGMAVTTIGDSLTCGSFLTAEADTLASVTGRGATTATASSFTGGATLRGLTVDTATATDDLLLMSITAGGATRFNGTITNADLTANRTYTLPDASGTLAVSASGNIALSTAGNITFTGTLPVANGGTGATTHTAGGILFGNGTSAFTNSGVLTNGQLLIGDGTGAPTVGTLTAGTGISITNGAGTITVASTITDTNTTYSAGNDLDLTGTTFDIESQLDFVSVINQTSANLTLQTTTSGNIILNSAGTIELQDNTNVTGNVVAAGTGTFSGASVTIGAAALQGSLVLHDGTGQTATISLGNIAANTTLTLPAALGATDTFCFVTLANCGGAGSGVTTVGAIDSQTKSANGAVISGTTIYLQTADASNPGLVSTGSQTFAGAKTFNSSVTVAANQTINLTGGATGSRPASPTEGMLFFDTTTKQLLTYSNGKWQATNGEYVIVAASNSSQSIKDAAHYVADGNTAAANDGDQVQINAALTAAAGGKVYLAQGTYVADATILIPNNTTLAGAGRGTLIELADLDVNENLIENSDTTTGTGVTIKDLRLDGRSDLNTAGEQHGIYLNGMGAGLTSGVRQGGKVNSVWASRFRTNGVLLNNSFNNTISDNSSLSNGNDGFKMTGSGNNVFSGNTAQNNTTSGYVLDSASHRNTLSNNTSLGNSSNGITLAGGSTYNNLTSNNISGNNAYGAYVLGSSDNIISGNTLHDNGNTTDNYGIVIFNDADNNTITSNRITDTSSTSTCDAIWIADAASNSNYLADNSFNMCIINDVGTGTIYGGQVDASGNYDLQPSGSISLLKNTDVTGALTVSSNATVSGGTLTVGAAATAANLALHDGTGQTATINVGNVAANTVISIPAAVGATDTFCLVTLANCGDGGVLTVGTFSTTNTAANGATITGTEIIFQSASATAPGMVDTAAQTFAGAKTFNANVTVGSNLTVDTNTLFVDATLNTVGIGTVSTEYKLHVVSDGAANGGGFISNDAYGTVPVFQGRRANGTLAAPTAITDGDTIAQFSARGYDGTGWSGTRAAIIMAPTQNWSSTAHGTSVSFYTTQNDTTSLQQRMILSNEGYLGLGTGSALTPTALLHVERTATSLSGTVNQVYSRMDVNPASDSSAQFVSGNMTMVTAGSSNLTGLLSATYGLLQHSGTGALSNARGNSGYVYNSSTGTIADASGVYGSVIKQSTGAVTTAKGVTAYIANSDATGAITSARAFSAETPGATGAITNAYGLYIENQAIANVTNAYGVYQAGANTLNYFAGNVGIGDTSPAYLLTVGNGDLFGVNSSGQLLFEGATVDANQFTVTVADPTADRTYTIPNSTATTDTFCLLTLANCSGSATTLQASYDADTDGGDAIITLTAADDSLIFRNPAAGGSDSTFVLKVDQLNTGAVDGLIVNHAGTGNALRINDDGTDTDSTPLVVDASGNLVVGLASAPSTMGKILSAVSSSSTTQFTNPAGALGLINTDQTANNFVEMYFGDEVSNASAGISAKITDHTNNYADLLFSTRSAAGLSTKLTVLSGGNVGIGTAAPEFKLQVAGAGNNFVSNDAYAGIGVFQGRRANGTQAAPTALGNNEVITQLSARGHDGSAWSGTQAAITLQTIGAWTGTSKGTAIRFQVTDQSTTTLVQQAGINSDGSFVVANGDVSSDGARMRVVAHSASTIGTIIQGTSTQTADILKLKRDTLDVMTVAGTGAVVMRNSANSTDAFQVQNASSQRVLGVNTTAGEVNLGSGSTLTGRLVVHNSTNNNTVTLTVGATSASYTLTLPTSVGSANQCLQNSATPGILTWASCGGGASTKTIKVLAEYAGGILSADGTSNTGTMAANHDNTARRNYYEWTTTQGTAQDYDVVATVQIPSDFVSIGAASGFKFYMYDGDGATTTAKVTWTVVDGSGTQCFSSDFNGAAANTWEQMSASSLGTCAFSANSEVTFRFKLTTTSGAGSIRIGGFEYQYSN